MTALILTRLFAGQRTCHHRVALWVVPSFSTAHSTRPSVLWHAPPGPRADSWRRTPHCPRANDRSSPYIKQSKCQECGPARAVPREPIPKPQRGPASWLLRGAECTRARQHSAHAALRLLKRSLELRVVLVDAVLPHLALLAPRPFYAAQTRDCRLVRWVLTAVSCESYGTGFVTFIKRALRRHASRPRAQGRPHYHRG